MGNLAPEEKRPQSSGLSAQVVSGDAAPKQTPIVAGHVHLDVVRKVASSAYRCHKQNTLITTSVYRKPRL